ncbi:type VI secretion system Vgr family protein [Shewanella marina]|uniref:type VI secretion system Vgr family protein n=1 Tax=Shewanella marina TaxID=487319 RepID=UPI0004700A97|nr:type VI secretion system tip protein VgrG [Shewanella marina]
MAANKQLHFTLTIDGLAEDKLKVVEFTGHEGLSTLYEYQLQLASRDPDIDAMMTVDRHACLTIYEQGQVSHRISGIVKRFSQGDTGHHFTRYQLTLVPAIARLGLRHNSRIFQQLSVPEIISVLLQEMNIDDYAFSLSRTLPVREYCVQYRETDLEFIARLASEEGIFYSFLFEQDKHSVLFSDDSQSSYKLAQPLPYNGIAGGVSEQPFVYGFIDSKQIASSSAQLKDYSFKKPAFSFLNQQQGIEMDYQTGEYPYFDYPGRYKDDESGKAYTQIRLEYLRRAAQTASAQSNVAGVQSGCSFDLQDHPDSQYNRDWLVTELTCQGAQPQSLEEEGGEGATTYNNQFELIPGHLQWRPIPNPKPKVDGPQIATVVGPEGEQIFCDEFGRVKVQFPWDRYGNGDDLSSCWVRVSQGWAGGQYGMLAIPRIGHEVIVSFLEGDPDQPIITGRTYHAVNQPPYPLPDHKTRTVIRTQTHQGEGFNELRFEDQAGQEEIYVHAQKDLNLLVEHDRIDHIKHDKHVTVENDRFSHIKGNEHITVDGESREFVKGERSLVVEGALHIKTGSVWVNQAGDEIHIKAGQKVVIESGAEITVKAGGSFIKLDPAGVHVVGSTVKINAGGSAGSGCGYAGRSPELPKQVDKAKAPAAVESIKQQASESALTPALKHKVIADLMNNNGITEVCQKQTDGSCPLTDCPCRNNL